MTETFDPNDNPQDNPSQSPSHNTGHNTGDDTTDESTTDDARLEAVSTYERIMVAAREARRINDEIQLGRVPGTNKPTTLAIRRATDDSIAFRYRERDAAPREPLGGETVFDEGAH